MTYLALLLLGLLLIPPVVLGTMASFWRTGERHGTWYWRLWWFYGYHCGFYRLNWAWKRRRA